MTNIIELARQAGLELNWFDDNFPVLHGKLINLEQLIRADERASLDAPECEPLSDARIISLAYDCNAMPEFCTDESLKLFAHAIEQEVRGK